MIMPIIIEGFQALGLAPIEFEKCGSIAILYPSGGGGGGSSKTCFLFWRVASRKRLGQSTRLRGLSHT